MAAITADTPDSHRRLSAELGLPFAVLSDPDFAVSERYGIYRSDEVDQGPQPHGEPAVFILDVQGHVAYSQILSGPKGLANPSEMALVLQYMHQHNGRYWYRYTAIDAPRCGRRTPPPALLLPSLAPPSHGWLTVAP
jgi:hypothetical protein